jgi:hypothetical protein
LTLGGTYGFILGMSADGTTIVGYEYDDATFLPYLWIWHDGDSEATPLHPEFPGLPWGISADGLTIVGAKQQGNDSHGFVIRNGVLSELSFPNAFTTVPYAGVSRDGSVSAGIVLVRSVEPPNVDQGKSSTTGCQSRHRPKGPDLPPHSRTLPESHRRWP